MQLRRYLRLILPLLLLSTILPFLATAQSFFNEALEAQFKKTTQNRVIVPEKYRTLQLDTSALLFFLGTLPSEKAAILNRNNTPVIELPMPDGSAARFRIWESSTMAPELAARYPNLRTFTGQGITDSTATLKLDWTELGFHAQILSPVTTAIYIDPYAQGSLTAYISYYKKDLKKKGSYIELPPIPIPGRSNRAERVESMQCIGTQLRTYRLAVACTGEYAVAATGVSSPTRAQALSAIVTTVNRVDGIYEKELALRMVLVATEDSVVYTNPATDPFTGNSDANTLISESQTVIDNRIGTANYDMGHTFSTGGGGLSGLGIICIAGQKAQSITGSSTPTGDGYDVDYVAHEMGHAVGANHTFNSKLGSCNGNGVSSTNVEPGSGTTIMAYAGICLADDIQPHSDPQFHAVSLDEISTYTFFSTGNTCGTLTSTGNIPPVVDAGANYTIPKSTPFILTGSATDANGDAITYSWEEIDKGGAYGAASAPTGNAPLFRSFAPVLTPTRYFPKLSDVINNTTTIGEILPSYARTVRFRLTARDNRAAGGGVCFDSTSLVVDGTASPFAVTAPTATGIVWHVNDFKTVTWDASTTAAAPIGCANVTIQLSTDGGNTFPITLLASTPNDGSEEIQVPNNLSTNARIRVMAVGNVFYDMSNNNFTIQASPTADFVFNNPATVMACSASNPSTVLKTGALGGFANAVTLSASGAPAGTTVTFSQNPVAPNSSSTVTLNNANTLAAGSYSITISGIANGASTKTRIITFSISRISISTATIANGTTGTPYTQSFTATGGNGTYVYSVSGSLPTGITLSGNTLSGTPVQAGSFPIIIIATDATGCTDSKSYTLVIAGTSVVTVSPGNGNYGTLKDAFDAINAGTHTGNITININGSTTESAPSVLNASGTGSASYTGVLIHPTVNGISISGSITGSAVIELIDADNIIIDGSVTGGTATGIGGNAALRNLTVKNTSTTATAGAVIAVKQGTNGAQNVTIKNLVISGQDPTQTLIGIHIGASTIGSAPTVNNNNITVENCDVQKTFFGIYDPGATASPATGHIIRRNNLSSTGVNRIRRAGILFFNQDGILVTENRVGGIVGDESADAIGIAAGIQNVNTTATTGGGIINSTISKNIVDGIASTSTVGFSASGIAIAGGAGANTISNNMVSGITAPSTNPDIVTGIFVAGVTGASTNLFYNTISLSGDRGSVASQIGSYGIAISGTDPVVTLKDNIITTTQTSAGGTNAKSYALGMATTTFANLTSDYNDFFFSGANAAGFRSGSLGTTGTDYATLAAWQSTTGKDAHSVSVAPVFVSSTDLHLLANSNPGINNKGIPITSPSITTDIDGDTRDAAKPDIGADERNDPGVDPPVVTGFTPISGPLGIGVTITGSYFNATPSNNIVYFGAVKATVTAGSTTSLTVTVPAGTTYQNLSVLNTVNGLTGYSSEPFVTTFANPFGTGIPANYYKPKVDFTTGTTPASVALGDLDGDGKADMVIANYSSNTVSVLRNISASGSISTSSFAAKVDFGTGNLPFSVAINDVDGDGKKDIVVANNGSNNISVLRNTAASGSITTSSFAGKVDFTTGNNPYFITIGDIDGDGKPELVTANSSPNSFSVLRNTIATGVINATSFAAKVDYAAGFSPQSVAINDVDGDGKPEVITANNGSNNISVFRNTSASGAVDASSFAARVDFATSNGPRGVAVGDIDGDGKPDVVVTNQNFGTVSVLRNSSIPGTINASSLAAKIDFSTGSSSTSVAIGDLDGDGKPDLAVTNQSSNTLSVLRNTSTSGNITASSFAAKVDFATGSNPASVAIGDIDGDGKAEVAITNQSTNPGTVSVFQISAPATTSTDYFRTRQSGNWSDVNTWESATDAGFTTGINNPATLSPDFNANTITVRHNVNVAASVKTDQTIINAGDTVFVNPNVILTLNDGTGTDLSINGTLTIRSTAAGTGAIGNSTTATVAGNAIAERYIPARRAWRLLTTPLSNTNTIYQAWQNSGVYNAGSGTFVTGPGGGNGLDNGNTYSLKTYNSTTQLLENVVSTNTALSGGSSSAANKGYFMFVRGDRSAANLTPPNTNTTTLRSIGSLQTGTQTFTASSLAGNFTLAGNPYASPVDFSLITRNNIPKRFYAWDPSLNTVGGYVLLDDFGNTGNYSVTPASSQTNILQSSQAFFVQTAAAGSASFVFNESNKSAVSTNAGFRTNDGTSEVLRTSLYLKNSDSSILADGVLAEYNNNYSKDVNIEDAPKFGNINENLAIQREGYSLSIERRPLVDLNDTLFLNLTNTTSRNYTFRFEPSNISSVVSAWLEDSYLKTSTPLSIASPTTVDFSVAANTPSANASRFIIVFITNGALPISTINVKAYQQNAGIQVDWNVATESDMSRYEVEKSADGQTFAKVGTAAATGNSNAAASYNWFDVTPFAGSNFYRIKAISKSGEVTYSQIINVKVGNGKSDIVVYPNPVQDKVITLQFSNQPKGTYTVQLFNALGQQMLTKTIAHLGGSATQTIQLGALVSKGIYQLQISNGDNKVKQQIIIQ